jgi:hypothetical protein
MCKCPTPIDWLVVWNIFIFHILGSVGMIIPNIWKIKMFQTTNQSIGVGHLHICDVTKQHGMQRIWGVLMK